MRVFAAGTSSYGVSDLKRLSEVTHKYQSWYVQSLLGGTYEQKAEVYLARSPLYHVQNIKVPVLVSNVILASGHSQLRSCTYAPFKILQGSADLIVPPSQAEAIVEAIRKQGGDVEYHVFEGEAHGWRQAKTIETAREKEYAFYRRVLKL